MIEERIPEKQGISFAVDEGERFEVTDPEGEQVADLVAFNRHDVSERFSPKYSYRRNNKLRPTTGDTLYTTEGKPILEFVDDDCGIHDLLYAPCNHWVVGDYYGQTGEGGCRENLTEVLEPEGVSERDLQETLNVFMKSTVEDQTHVEIAEPESEPGDTVTFEAKQDTIVGVAACSGESTVNAGDTKPIDIRVPENAILHRNY
ncbi:urea carboxylase-associated family protein [Natronorarus salvus]|uniref:urea carboxylase-associated family protein n=1 Tax=Natronorarus salvus TaxID=3117733 RepID=UPI002F265AF2